MNRRSHQQVAAAFVRLLPNHDRHELIAAVAGEIRARGWVKQLNIFLQAVNQAIFAATGRLAVELTTAHPLTDSTRSRLKHFLQEKLTADDIELIEQQDARLVGGFIARSGEKTIDASVATKLLSLHRHV